MECFLQDVNKQLQTVHEHRGLPVLSFGEGSPTTINTILPKLTVSVLTSCSTRKLNCCGSVFGKTQCSPSSQLCMVHEHGILYLMTITHT